MNIFSGIYGIQSISNGYIYIGGSYDVKNRWILHKSLLRRNCHHCKPLQNHWNEYGKDDLKFFVFQECHPDMLFELEKFYFININNKFNSSLKKGKRPGLKTSIEVLKKISLSSMDPIAHGTNNGYQQELQRKILPCHLCFEAHKKYMLDYKKKKGSTIWGSIEHLAKMRKTRRPIVHGTYSGYQLEYHRGLKHCKLCVEARKLYLKNRMEKNLL